MVERQDIDALLISALYGELTPAEEARLTAHLESHPMDRTALDDLRGTREKLQQSRILTFQYEPPQSVSALLMQEASRRAPKKPVEGEGWFARFVRSFIQHPAMAAAAMIVVVVGASALVSRTGNKFAETPAVETSKADESMVAMEAPAAGLAPTPSAAPMTGADQYRVDLADGELDNVEEKKKQKQEGSLAQQALPETDPSVAFYDSQKSGDSLKAAKPKGNTKADMGLELRRREAMPKDLDDAPAKPPEGVAKNWVAEGKEKLNKSAETERQFAESATPDEAAPNREQAGYVEDGRARAVGGAGGGAPGAVATPTAPAKQPTPKPATTAAQGPRNATTTRTSPPPPPPAPRQEIATDATGAAQKTKPADKAPNDPNLAWAKDQHAALVTAVRANNCGRAASIALSIANRAPGYYAQNVETDRSVKECIAYINNEREKDAEVRASRAKKSQLKAAEPASPSAPKRAADQPSRATNADTTR
jgi:hypothetical protein